MSTSVPSEFCYAVFDSRHTFRLSIQTTQCLVTACYVWPNINNDIYKLV